MRIGTIQLNYTIADVSNNIKKAMNQITQLDKQGTDLIVLSELLTTGYPPKDLLIRKDLITQNLQARDQIVEFTKDIKSAVAFGYVDINPNNGRKSLFNSVCVAQGGKILQIRHKVLLPTYDVFSEDRYFEPGSNLFTPLDIAGTKVSFLICEEVWNPMTSDGTLLYDIDPVAEAVSAGAEHIAIVNASPYRLGVNSERHELLREHTAKHRVGFTYVNQVGYNDSIGFDGNSFGMNRKGEIIFHAPLFQEFAQTYDTNDIPIPDLSWEHDWEDEICQALTVGINDYFNKNGITGPAIVCNSGGIDSALVLYFAVRARGPANVISISLPSEFSSQHSIDDAKKLADKLGIKKHVQIPIQFAHQIIRQTLDSGFEQIFESNKFENLEVFGQRYCKTKDSGVTDENIQARIRGLIGMAFANRFGGLMLSTSNKSEAAVGYTTIYGDMCGGLAVIIDLLKTQVYSVSKWLNKTFRDEIIPYNTINKIPSAELKPNQFDQQSLPPYELVDAVLELQVENHATPKDIFDAIITEEKTIEYLSAHGRNLRADIEKVILMTIAAEHKRQQSPTGLKISHKLFKSGWDMPIAHKMRL